jgi:hypothetical protein
MVRRELRVGVGVWGAGSGFIEAREWESFSGSKEFTVNKFRKAEVFLQFRALSGFGGRFWVG